MSADSHAGPDAGTEPASGREALLRALEVRRNARIGIVAGLVFAVGVAVLFLVVLAGGRTVEPTPYYLGLAFVVFVTTTMLATSVLTARRALRLALHPIAIVRRGAALGAVGGLAYLVAAVGLALDSTAGSSAALTAVGYTLPWAPLLTLGGVWAVHTRDKRLTELRPLGAIGALLAVGGALVIADLAALELSQLVAPEPSDAGLRNLFLAGALAVALGHAIQAIVGAAAGADWRRSALLGGAPLAGVAGLLALGDGSPAIAVFAAGCGLAWLPVGLALYRLDRDAVPSGPELLPESEQ